MRVKSADAFLTRLITSFSCVLRTRPENDIGSGLQPLLDSGDPNSRVNAPLESRSPLRCFAHWARSALIPRMSLLRISYEGAAAPSFIPKDGKTLRIIR